MRVIVVTGDSLPDGGAGPFLGSCRLALTGTVTARDTLCFRDAASSDRTWWGSRRGSFLRVFSGGALRELSRYFTHFLSRTRR